MRRVHHVVSFFTRGRDNSFEVKHLHHPPPLKKKTEVRPSIHKAQHLPFAGRPMTNPRPGLSSKWQMDGALPHKITHHLHRLHMKAHEVCTPIRCPTTEVFDLEAMLIASTTQEDSALDALVGEGPDALDDTTHTRLPPTTDPAPTLKPSTSSSLPDDPKLTNSPTNPQDPQPRNYQHRYRKRKRDAEIREVGHVPRKKTLSTLVPLALEATNTCRLDYIDLPATDGAYSAMLRKKKKDDPTTETASDGIEVPTLEDRVYTLPEVQALGLRVFPWDGMYVGLSPIR